MPWSPGDYPASMKNLDPKVRRKAIEVANAVLEKTGDEGKAISVGIAQAKKGGDIQQDHQQSIRELTMAQADPGISDKDAPQQYVPHPTGGTRAFAPGPPE